MKAEIMTESENHGDLFYLFPYFPNVWQCGGDVFEAETVLFFKESCVVRPSSQDKT